MDYLNLYQEGDSWFADLLTLKNKFVFHQQIEFRKQQVFLRFKKRLVK